MSKNKKIKNVNKSKNQIEIAFTSRIFLKYTSCVFSHHQAMHTIKMKGERSVKHCQETYPEQLSILFKKLGQIAVSQSTNKHNVLIKIWVASLECTSHDQNRFDSTHTKVIMILLRELFAAQAVHLYHLTSQILRGFKSF